MLLEGGSGLVVVVVMVGGWRVSFGSGGRGGWHRERERRGLRMGWHEIT
jgi:hypothetical protein